MAITFILLLTVIYVAARLFIKSEIVTDKKSALYEEGLDTKLKMFGKIATVVYVFLVVISVALSSIKAIDAGEQGVVTRFGKVQGNTIGSGLHVVIPFVDNVKRFSVREEKITADADAASKDLQTVKAQVAVNLRLDPNKINDLYKTIGVEWQGRIVDPAIQETVKAATAQFTAEELITRRPEVAAIITKSLSDRLIEKNIIVTNVSITNFDFSPAFNAAIEAKQVAQQNVAKASQDLERVKVEAAQKVAQAEAEAASLRAQKQEITPDLIQLRQIEAQIEAIKKWNGVLPTTNASSSLPFLNITK